MDILAVTRGYPPQKGGVENYMGSIYELLKEEHDVKVAVYEHEGHDGPYFREVKRRFGNGVLELLNFYSQIFTTTMKEDCDVIHANTEIAGLGCVIPSIIKRKPLVTTIHDAGFLEPNEQMGWGGVLIRKYIRKFVHTFSSSIITGGKLVKEDMIEYLGMNPEKVSVIPYGIDNRGCSPDVDTSPLGIPEDEKVIVFVGMLYPKKGLKYALEALESLDVPNTKLYIVGGEISEGYTDSLKKQAKDLGIEDDVVFVGLAPEEDIPKWYARADIFILPTVIDREGFSVTCLEANMSGTPVITTTPMGDTGVVTHEYNGLIVPRRDSEALENALHRILTDGELNEELSINGIEFASQFTCEKAARKHLDLFKTVTR